MFMTVLFRALRFGFRALWVSGRSFAFQELTGFGCGFSGLRDFDMHSPAYRF